MKPVQLPLGVRLRDDATFANFYPGINAAAQGYVERLCEPEAGWVESLVYLWGPLGVGRSHLLQAACHRLEQQGAAALYLPLEEVAELGPALLEGLEQFELVCLDDVQRVATDPQWQEALFHLFNRLRDSGRRLLLSADAAPRELPLTLADLRSRLSQALVFQLHELSDEDKLRALQLRAFRRGLQMSEEAGRFILTRSGRSMNELFDVLERLDQASLQAQRKLTIPFLKEVLDW
ncbi:regulatory inactivation of DnaA Hda protein [Atopomonas hussainii]|uniref:Regulatory inactivation of DnaA Hda protein n=1 Tax=Atopomonas hussainii TaxID=1429083 RepID=A0A1H7PHC6_9GAMM|nr:DnaA regulatory inactivator Hda [Atopomonas hussainii]SEL34695.1 regulatory inactivation of DnaA Hda protein [Atopomonas hussainii]